MSYLSSWPKSLPVILYIVMNLSTDHQRHQRLTLLIVMNVDDYIRTPPPFVQRNFNLQACFIAQTMSHVLLAFI